jgi:hypothetical protein
MNRFSSHPNHENHDIYEGPPPQGISEARRAESFFEWDFCYMLNNKLNAHGGFTPAAVAPPKCDNLEQEIRHVV